MIKNLLKSFGYVILFFLTLVVLSFANQITKSNYKISERFSGQNSDIKKEQIIIDKNNLNVEVADTDVKRIKGLSGRDSLSEDEGMLFIFNNPGLYYFWMKDMKFPLDFIWINDNEVVDLTQNVLTPDNNNPSTFTAKSEFDKVIEVNAGYVKNNEIKIGDKIEVVK